MGNAMRMNVMKTSYHLLHNVNGVLLCKLAARIIDVNQLPVRVTGLRTETSLMNSLE